MRNLKRALSLAMASIMILGMMVVGASAASFDTFSDRDKVVNKDAVSILNTLGVIAGRDDGSFDPTGIVTRGEMAKMICVVLNGGRDPQLGTATTNSYSDTVGHWAAGYIEYCTKLGIVSGKGDGTFQPNATVTGVEAAKMLLVAMGYNAAYESMVGSQWDISVNVLANQNDLYAGLDLNPGEGLSRDNAAQMVYNALNVDMVKYNNALVSQNGTLVSIATVEKLDGKTILTEKFGAVKVTGVVVANEAADLEGTGSNKANKTTIAVTNGAENSHYSDGNKTFTVSSDLATLGRSVTLYVKPYASNKADAEKALVIGSAIVSESDVVVTDYSADSIADVAKDNKLKTDSNTQSAYNYGSNSAITISQGVEKILIDNDNDGVIEWTIVNRYDLGKVTKYATKDDGAIVVKTDASSAEYEKDDVVGFDDVAKDDFVLTAVIGGKLHVERAETVTGKLEAYKQNSSSVTTSLTIDGTAYKTSNSAKVHADLTNGKDYGPTHLDAEATFYLNKQGYVVAAGDVEEAAYAYAFVIAKAAPGNNIDSNRVKVALPDGKTAVYEFSKNTGTKGVELISAVTEGHVYRYTITSDNKIKLTDDAVAVTSTAGDFEKNKAAVNLTGSNSGIHYSTNNTLFFYTDTVNAGDDVDVYTGFSSAPSTEVTAGAGKSINVWKSGNRVVAVTVVGGNKALSVGDHMFIYSVGSTYSDYTLVNAVLSGKGEITENIKISKDTTATLTADTLYTYNMNTKGEYVLKEAAQGKAYFASGSVTDKFSGSFVISGGTKSGEYGLTSNTVVIDNVDASATPSVELKGGFSKGDLVNVLFDAKSGNALMVVITKNDTSIYDVNVAGLTNVTAGDITVDGVAVSALTADKFAAASGSAIVITNATDIANGAKYTLGNGTTVTADSTGNTLRFTMPEENVTVARVYKLSYIVGIGTSTAPADTWHVNAATVPAAAAPTAPTTHSFIGWSDGTDLYAAADEITVAAADVALTAVYVSKTIAMATPKDAGGLAAAGVTIAVSPADTDISAFVTAEATGAGGLNSIADADADVITYSTPNLELPFTGETTDLSGATTGDSITFTLTVTYKDSDTMTFTFTHSYS